MNTEKFIAQRIIASDRDGKRFSKPIVRISVLAIALGLAVMILTVAIITGFKNEIQNKLIGFGSHIQIVNYDGNESEEPLPIEKNQAFLPSLKELENVNHFQTFANKSGIIKTKTENDGVVLKGVGTDYDWTFIKKHLKEGRVVNVADAQNKEIILSKYYANQLRFKIGDKVVIHFLTKKNEGDVVTYLPRAKAFKLVGIYETGLEDIDKNIAVVDIRHIQSLNYWNENLIAGYEVAVSDYSKIELTTELINELIGFKLIAQSVKERNYTLFSWLELQDINAIVIIVLMILVAGINMISALLILILERTGMIGILKALGAKNSSIQKIFLMNASYLIGKGLLWGNIVGISIALLQQHFGIIKLDQTAYYVSVIPINLNLMHIVLLNIGTLTCCLLMLLLPSLVISKINPVKAIRFS